jgi:predicted acylesterase/phospholipase RssA
LAEAPTDDLIGAIIASSALPGVYEPIMFNVRLHSDGGIVANHPIRPAIRLGAEVMFLVMMNPLEEHCGELKTFIDVGQRALDILMLHNLVDDVKSFNKINSMCERAAAELDVRPDETEIDLGTHRYRYIKSFTIRPAVTLGGTTLDFNHETIGRAVLQGYQDARVQIESFLTYAQQARSGGRKRTLRIASEVDP